MPSLLTNPPRADRLHGLAKSLLSGLAFVLALSLGLALFLPWDLIWPQILAQAVAGKPGLALGWRSMENPSVSGFTLRGVSLNATGLGSAEAESLALRFGLTPISITGATVNTQRGLVHLDRAWLELGYSPLAVLHVAAREELSVSLIQRHTVVVGGKTDLAALLPSTGLTGVVGIYADMTWQDWGHYPTGGSAEISAPALSLPDGRTVSGLSGSASLAANQLTLRELSLQQPVPLRGRGSATLDWSNVLASPFEFSGLAYPGTLDTEVQRKGRLYELVTP